MSFEDCIDLVVEASAGKLSKEEALKALDDVLARKERIMARDPLSSEGEARLQAARELADETKIAALIEKRSRAINLLRSQERHARVERSFKGKEHDGLQSISVGIEGREVDSAFSQDAQQKGIQTLFLGPLVGELRQIGVFETLTESAMIRAGQAIGMFKGRKAAFRKFEMDVARELSRIDDPTLEPPTGNKLAEQTAAIFNKYQNAALAMQNEAGAWIRKMPGYIARQKHDQLLIAGKGTEADYVKWRDTILPETDERTFEGIDNREEFLKEAWLALASGVHEKPGADWLGGFKGPSNIAKRASQQRSWHFKSSDSWYRYNEVYGGQSLFESIVHGFTKAAQTTAALRVWGTNPEAAFTRFREELVAKVLERGDLKTANMLQGKGPTGDYLKRQFDAASGLIDVPESPSLARVGANVRGLVNMAKLVNVVLSSFPDMAAGASVLKHNGVGLIDRWNAVTFGAALRGPLTGEKRQAVDYLGLGVDSMLGGIANRFSATDQFHGKMSKMQDIFFRINLLGFWTDREKQGISDMLAHHMANESGKTFDALHPRHQVTLGRYGITSDTWDLMRRTVAQGEDGRQYLMPELMANISDDDLRAYLGKPKADARALDRERTTLTIKLRAYYAEQTRDGLTEPGARERAITTLGSRPGTPLGEAIRMFMHFKSFPVTFVTRHFGREIYQAGSKSSAFINMAVLIAGTTVLGGLSNAANDLVRGRIPRNPLTGDPKNDFQTLTAAMLKGGGLGIYGDFLLGQASLSQSLAGPTVGTLADLKKIYDPFLQGSNHPARQAGAQAVRFVANNTPFINLFYTKLALDYLIVHAIQESMNPGFLQRYEASTKRDRGQKFWISPSKFNQTGQIQPSQ